MFKIIGADQKEYGPVSTTQIRQWITDGRLNAATRAQREGGGDWQPLSAFEEFADLFGIAPGPMPTGVTDAPPAAAMPSAPIPTASREMALSAVKGPAIALIVVASLGIAAYLFVAFSIFVRGNALAYQPMSSNPNLSPAAEQFMRGPMAAIAYLVFAAIYGFLLFGALRMLKLQGHTLAIITCIVAMLPCGCCCFLGLPFAIWGLVVLNKPEVKSQFTN